MQHQKRDTSHVFGTPKNKMLHPSRTARIPAARFWEFLESEAKPRRVKSFQSFVTSTPLPSPEAYAGRAPTSLKLSYFLFYSIYFELVLVCFTPNLLSTF